MVIVVYALELDRKPDIHISAESKEARFFTAEELKTVEIPVTHRDIVEECFINRVE